MFLSHPYTRALMKIVLVNWARIWEGAEHGGGVNVYAQQLALELTRRGHDVMWLSSGVAYVPAPLSAAPGECRVRRHDDWRSVRTFEVINSPVVAPGPCQFRDPLGEVSSPELEREITRFFHLVEPDIVHFHNIEGFSAGCVAAAKTASPTWPGAKVVFSLHNYHTICPQVYLMQGGRRACHDFDNGHACTGCIDAPEPDAEKRMRAAAYASRLPAEPAPETEKEKKPSGVLAGLFVRGRAQPIVGPPLPGYPVENFADTLPQKQGARAAEESTDRVAAPFAPESAEWTPLSNDIPAASDNARAPNDFGRRRRAMVDMLSRCDRAVAVSDFVRRKFQSLGVNPGVLRTLAIGSRMPEMTERCPELRFSPPPFDAASPRPIRAVFMGYNNFYKGLPMLCDSLELLTPEYLGRIHLSVYAKAVEEIEWRLRRLEARLAGLVVQSGYRYDEVPRILSGKDFGLVPSVWWDNGPQTVMEYLSCGLPVVGARLGGVPDLVTHGVNGLLFTGNDRFDLARTLVGIIHDPTQLFTLRANVRAPKAMTAHSAEVEALYADVLSER
jgi:glycosyltransferase involved in cell wall biosynthesis